MPPTRKRNRKTVMTQIPSTAVMHPPSALVSALDIDWILQEPCATTWTDKLDGFKEHALGDSCPVTLWIGARPTERVWVAVLQVTITAKLCRREKPFDFFVFLDPRKLNFERDGKPVVASPCALGSLLKAFPAPSRGGWLHIAVQQERSTNYLPGRVLMEERSASTLPFSDASLHLLMQTRALSQGTDLNMHFKNSRSLRKVLNMVRNRVPLNLPTVKISLSLAYQGSGGDWDVWGQYGKELVGPHRLDLPKNTKAPPSYSKTPTEISEVVQDPSTPPFSKRAPESKEESSVQKRVRYTMALYPDNSPTEVNTPSTTQERPSQRSTQDDQSTQVDHAVQHDWTAQDDESTQDSKSAQDDQVTHDYESTREQRPLQAAQYTVNRVQLPDLEGPLPSPQNAEVPPYAASIISSETDKELDIKPTLFTRGSRNHNPPALTLAGLGDLITAAVQAQIPVIAAQVQQRTLSAEMTALAKTLIADYVSAHMPNLMQGHLSDLHDEWDSASASLLETKDEAITDIHSERDTALKEIQDESQTCFDDFVEKTEQFKEEFVTDLEDKCGKFEDQVQARIDALPPQNTRDTGIGGRNSAKDAVRLFQRDHQGYLTPEQQVKVLLSIAKWNNAEVFMAAEAEMQEALVKHWAGVADYVSSSGPASL